MFQKSAHIVLSFLLLTATMGFTMSKHYCGAELIEVTINAESEPCCDDSGSSGCCHDETFFFQFDEDYVSSVFTEDIQPSDFNTLFPAVFVYLLNVPEEAAKEILNFAESPPPPNLHTELSFLQTFLI